MHHSLIPTSLTQKVSQQQITEFLKNNRMSVIQTSGGLCVKSSEDLKQLKEKLAELDADLIVRPLSDDEKSQPDVQAFLRDS